ncbi:MAG: UTP--glucose-1-phosphate uridylyltransferase [Firmicutes bacterium]|nr:UTP--glucose-1-phosphate uridylyltransferase [Bacillota bacterium]
MKITKALIPCAGLGTRFAPITKAVPKEMLPIIDTPSLHYIINEAVASGITDIMLVLSPNKNAIKTYVDAEIIHKANIIYAYQNEPRGSADAVYKAKNFVGSDPFCLAWGDDVILSQTPVMKQLMNAFDDANSHVVGMQYWKDDDIIKYGVAKLGKSSIPMLNRFDSKLFLLGGFLEKPALKDLPSRYAALGRYILTSDIFDEIEITPPSKNGEIQLTDAINSLSKKSNVFGYDFDGKRFDCGDKLGFIKAIIEYGLMREFGGELKEYIKDLIKIF